MTLEERFKKEHSNAYFLDAEEIADVENYLRNHNWLGLDEGITSLEKAGEGNMNLTLRVQAKDRTFIIKQARPWVEKYPQIDAPVERSIIEGEFYDIISNHEKLKQLTPEVLGKDPSSFLLVFEDLGVSSDYTDLYASDKALNKNELEALMVFLNALHGNFTGKGLQNSSMRQLNHEHIFVYPFLEENGLNLDDIENGLQEVAMTYKTDGHLKEVAKTLGEKYLADGDYLLHGDYYPGSWLRTTQGIKVIDPEFSFSGLREFELGVMLAHLKMAEQSEEIQARVIDLYEHSAELDGHLLNQFIGIEIMRRIIGLAQLPMSINLERKKGLLQEAHNLLLEPRFSKVL